MFALAYIFNFGPTIMPVGAPMTKQQSRGVLYISRIDGALKVSFEEAKKRF